MKHPLTIQVPIEVLGRLAERAKVRGTSVEDLAAELLASRATETDKTVMNTIDEVLEEFHDLHRRLAE